MKSHFTLWAVAVTMAAVAFLVYVSRNAPADNTAVDGNALVAEAINLLADDVSVLKHNTQAAIRAAAVYVERGDVASAQGAFVLAVQFKREQNLEGAESHFKRAIALDPTWSWPYAGLGDLLGRHSFQRREEAMEVLQKAVALDPEWGRPHSIMAVILRAERKFEAARIEAEKALKYMPEQLATLNNYANILMDLDRYEEAEVYLKKAIDYFPEQAKPYYNLACLYSLRNRPDESIELLKEAFKRSDSLRQEASVDGDLQPLLGLPNFEALLDRDTPQP